MDYKIEDKIISTFNSDRNRVNCKVNPDTKERLSIILKGLKERGKKDVVYMQDILLCSKKPSRNVQSHKIEDKEYLSTIKVKWGTLIRPTPVPGGWTQDLKLKYIPQE